MSSSWAIVVRFCTRLTTASLGRPTTWATLLCCSPTFGAAAPTISSSQANGADGNYTGVILHSSDDGASWQAQTSGSSQILADVWGSGPNNVFVVGDNGTILHTTNDGAVWKAQDAGTSEYVSSVWGSGPNDVFALTLYTRTILHNDGTVTDIPPDPVFTLNTDNSLVEQFGSSKILLSPAGTILSISSVTDSTGQADVFAVTSDHHLWEYTPGSWTMLSSGSFQQLSAATNKAGNAVVFAVLTDNSLLGIQRPQPRPMGPTYHRPAPSCRPAPSRTKWQRQCVRRHLRQPLVGTHAVYLVHALVRQLPVDQRRSRRQRRRGGLRRTDGQFLVGGTDRAAAGGYVWTNLSPAGTILAVSAAGPDQAFAITADHHLWQHGPSGWSLRSTGSFTSISGENNAGASEVFAVLADTSLWEYQMPLTGSPTWNQLDANGVLAASGPRQT